MTNYKELWYSGELAKAAESATHPAQLAAKYGVSVEALSRALRRLHEEDRKVPKLHELIVKKKAAAEGLGQAAAGGEIIEPIEEHKLRKKIRDLESRNKELMDKLLNTQDELGVVREAAQYKIKPIVPREHKSGLHEGCSLILVSDNHLGEHITKESTNGLNEHTPEIARARMEKLASGGVYLTNLARNVNKVRDVVLWFGGDHISGRIHEDLSESNAMSLPEELAFSEQALGDIVRHFLKDAQTESIKIICTPGNHSRVTQQMRVHTRIETNLETLVYLSLAREFSKEKRVSFDLPTSAITYFQVYGRTIRAFHGDIIKGGGGGTIIGIQGGLNRAILKWDQSVQAQLNLVAHFHSYQDYGKAIVNGSTVGTNAYSLSIACPHERPQQAWALLDSKRWRSLSAPIFCD